MHLLRMRLTKVGPFEDIELAFGEDGSPRAVTVIHGSGGVGKSTLLSAIACTRPGNASIGSTSGEHEQPGTTICEFHLGQDDPDRPHSLVIATPNARVYADNDLESMRRKEQSLFDRVAREVGFVFVPIPATRWFSRQPIVISSRSMTRYDVRASPSSEDPTRSDLARETKQILAYGAISRALASADPSKTRVERLASSLEHAVNAVLGLMGIRWVGLESLTLEPQFECAGERRVTFDHLPTRARHLLAFAALPVRALWAAYPHRDPLDAEGVVTIDEVDSYQEPALQAHLMTALSAALPRVQWIVTSTSPIVPASCDAREVIALRRSSELSSVQVYTGELARTH